jgi:hypothetical protein
VIDQEESQYAAWVSIYGLRAPYGECQCGCGRVAPLSKKNLAACGWKKGHPKRFVSGHNNYGPPLAERFWSRVVKQGEDGCWMWTGCVNRHGYGIINTGERNELAHRVAYELTNGRMLPGEYCLHRCDNPSCCNPSHLFTGTQRDNVKDMVSKGRNPKGSERPNALLTEVDVIEIRRLCSEGTLQKDVAKQYGVNKGLVGSIVRHTTWKHVP